LSDDLYFGGNDGIVYRADTGYTDNGAPLSGLLKTAFNYFGGHQNKFFTMMRPVFMSSGQPGVAISLSTDFGDTPPQSSVTPSAAPTGGVWGSIVWGSWVWGGQSILTKDWQTVGALGFCGAASLSVVSNGQSCNVMAFDLAAQTGGIL
jgi:hypothetical protein